MIVKCKCQHCGKDIFIDVPNNNYILNNSCNDCILENSAARDGINKSIYTKINLNDDFLRDWAEFMFNEYDLKVISYIHVKNEKYGTYLYLEDGNIIGMNFEEGYPCDICSYDLLDGNKNKIKTLGKITV